ncbi:MAG: alpha-amylase family glycosyl hydrolase [Candidatus Azobacteroides sp.]|nr:alpha-amylase family glycosyl hydrolase [Candidatus Azobacteroides sp.]
MKREKIIIYQVLPRLFGNRRLHPVFNGSKEENGCGKLSDFTDKVLNEIKTMGCTHIWYTGLLEHATQTDYTAWGIRKDHPAIVKGKAGSPYAIKDYYDIDPDLAENVSERMAEFEALVERTHRTGLKVIIDFVPNHVARQYHSDVRPEGIEDLGAFDRPEMAFAPDNNFYYIPGQTFAPDFSLESEIGDYLEYPAKATGNDCFSAHPTRNDWYETVKLNYGIDYIHGGQTYFSPDLSTWKKMRDILLFWANKGVDGFRCDMVEMTPVEFWAWAIPQVKEQHPAIAFIAEVYDPYQYRNYLHTGKFDYLYDKVGLYDTLRAVVAGEQPAKTLTHCWQSVGDIQTQMLNFLENHDEQRIASDFFAGNPFHALPALIVSATLSSNPFMLYFGQELGERGMDTEGFSGCDGRTSIFDYWSIFSFRQELTEDQKKLRRYYATILQECNCSKAIREGKFYDLMYVNPASDHFDPDKQFAYMRYHEGELLLIVAHFGDTDQEISIFLPEHAFAYFGIIEEKNFHRVKNLITNKNESAALKRDSFYPVYLPAHNAVIIQFVNS